VAPREPTRLTLSVRTATEAACGALRDAVGALDGAPASWSADEPRDSDRWADEGGPRASAVAGYPVAESDAADDRFRRGPARSAHDASPSAARDVAYAALGAYARALRHDGTPSPPRSRSWAPRSTTRRRSRPRGSSRRRCSRPSSATRRSAAARRSPRRDRAP
jgi:hypothetical protein